MIRIWRSLTQKFFRVVDEDFERRRLEKDENESDEDWRKALLLILRGKKQAAVDAVMPEDNESHVMKLAFECLKGSSYPVQGKPIRSPRRVLMMFLMISLS